MSEESKQLNEAARAVAERTIDAALGAMNAAAEAIGQKYGIPDNVGGNSRAVLLGRLTYVPSMARELRTICGQLMAKGEIERMLAEGLPGINQGAKLSDATVAAINAEVLAEYHARTPGTPKISTELEDEKPPAPVAGPAAGMDITQLEGVHPNTVKALQIAGITNVGELMAMPDEHLIKYPGIGDKTLAQLRLAISKAGQPAK